MINTNRRQLVSVYSARVCQPCKCLHARRNRRCMSWRCPMQLGHLMLTRTLLYVHARVDTVRRTHHIEDRHIYTYTYIHTCSDIIGRLYVSHEHATVIRVLSERRKDSAAKLFARSSRTIPLFQQREVYHSPTETSTFGSHVESRSNFILISISSSFDIEYRNSCWNI